MESRYYPELKGKADFWTMNFYTNHMINSRRSDVAGARYPHKRLRLIDKDFYHEEFVPDILMQGLERLKDKPIYITENGACCDDDRFRIVYMALHYTAFHHAISEGIDLRRKFHIGDIGPERRADIVGGDLECTEIETPFVLSSKVTGKTYSTRKLRVETVSQP